MNDITHKVRIINQKLIISENGLDVITSHKDNVNKICIMDETCIGIGEQNGSYITTRTNDNETAKKLVTLINDTLYNYEKLILSKITIYCLDGSIDQILLKNISTINFDESLFHSSDADSHKFHFVNKDEIMSGYLKKYTVDIQCPIGNRKIFFTDKEAAMSFYQSLNDLVGLYQDLVLNFTLPLNSSNDDDKRILDNTIYQLEQK